MSGPSRRHVLVLVLAAACWGLGAVLSKRAVAEIPPLTLLTAQLGVSVAVLGAVALHRREPLPGGRDGRLLGRLGLLNPGLAYALSLLGLVRISASLSVLVWAIEPILILAAAVLLLRERPGASLVALSGVAIAGLALVLYDPSAQGDGLGITLTVAGIACCALYTIATRHWLPGADSTLGVVVAQQAHALAFAVVLLGVGAVAGLALVPTSLSAAGVASTLVSGLIYYGLAYWLYLSGLRWVPASVAAVSFYLIPVFGVGAATIVGDRLTIQQWVGAGVVIAAVAVITIRSAGGVQAAGAAALSSGVEPTA